MASKSTSAVHKSPDPNNTVADICKPRFASEVVLDVAFAAARAAENVPGFVAVIWLPGVTMVDLYESAVVLAKLHDSVSL